MGFECGIVGLPNAGKSTLFNALTRSSNARAENYPFCTIDPNMGEVEVPDERLWRLAKQASSKQVIPTRISFVDIAGLVKGASQGAGLGNRFLSHIREVDALAHVVRCFVDEDVAHVEGSADSVHDAEIIETELMLSDMESLEKRIAAGRKKPVKGDLEAGLRMELLERALALVGEGRPARELEVEEAHQNIWHQLGLLTSKPMLYVCNVDESGENDSARALKEYGASRGVSSIMISARVEEELAGFSQEERIAYLQEAGLSEDGLSALIRAGYDLLELLTFFTVGEKEAHAWTVRTGSCAPEAAGRIHTDFERGFIRAEVVSWDMFLEHGGEHGAREAGVLRLEGREYVVCDGDVMHFRFAV